MFMNQWHCSLICRPSYLQAAQTTSVNSGHLKLTFILPSGYSNFSIQFTTNTLFAQKELK